MSVPEREALDETEADWYESLFRGSEAFAAILEESDVDVAPDAFERTDAYRPGGIMRVRPVVVRLTREGSGPELTFEAPPEDKDEGVDEVEHLTLSAQFDPEDDELLEARLQTGIVGELAGQGEIWEYRDGEVEYGNWTA